MSHPTSLSSVIITDPDMFSIEMRCDRSRPPGLYFEMTREEIAVELAKGGWRFFEQYSDCVEFEQDEVYDRKVWDEDGSLIMVDKCRLVVYGFASPLP